MNEYLEMILVASPLLILGVIVAGAAYRMHQKHHKHHNH